MLTPPAAPPPGRRAARLALLAALAVYMLGGPINGHLLGNRHRAWMHWGMYSTAGRDVCSIRFFLPGEESAPVDRLGSLGYAHSYEAPTKVRRLRKASGVRAQGAALCEALGVDDLRAQGRCGVGRATQKKTGTAWKQSFDGEKNLCQKRRR